MSNDKWNPVVARLGTPPALQRRQPVPLPDEVIDATMRDWMTQRLDAVSMTVTRQRRANGKTTWVISTHHTMSGSSHVRARTYEAVAALDECWYKNREAALIAAVIARFARPGATRGRTP